MTEISPAEIEAKAQAMFQLDRPTGDWNRLDERAFFKTLYRHALFLFRIRPVSTTTCLHQTCTRFVFSDIGHPCSCSSPRTRLAFALVPRSNVRPAEGQWRMSGFGPPSNA
jgi:hypothetical protein